MKQFLVVIDTLGSDKGPQMVVKGACLALKEFENLKVCLTGDSELINKTLEELGADKSRVKVIHAPDVISNYDHPVMAIREKTESSLVKALEELRDNEEACGMINAGSTGALLVGSMLYLGGGEVVRPCLAAVHQIILVKNQLGMKNLYKLESPKVGLLSNGAEETKGNALVKETHKLLKEEKDLNFVGNLEGTNALSGECDVLVCDGFAGNQVLKVSEGIARRLITDIVKLGKKSGNESYLKLAQDLAAMYDFNSLGGGIILGITKTVIKAHGAANEMSIFNTVRMLLNLAENKSVYTN